MFRSTFLPVESELNFLYGTTQAITVQSRLALRPYRLWVDPEVASGFLIRDVLVGNLSVLPEEHVTFMVEYAGPLECGPRFHAAWAAVVVPLSVAKTAREAGADIDPGPGLGLKDLGTRIQHVPAMPRSSSPGFGWDPYPGD
jgi:hypothetical protein